ncbi:ABC transporter ATP-binding protein [Halobacterium salinarum]|uniref:Simple sugar transport system ATP-binding protein n=3 Tax=Halobacterium salinarum TaxID=2242 RepID=A0A841HDU5_HALSI|nr:MULTISPECIES: ABC transporter ATP-binding protein [Halobacterium]AAG19337.1 ribose ABC transporter ATP-binding [Halobacterium salinarum NRC-1]MBB6090452.1 simple sugar transport system ATP-binding protein [Halobacterium salinarum]MCF2166434.1 ABC transporter ATP-binding protein [Halobacterium salinarum]MCF2168401.1 ABC transporter ATP-binding protein [Halobacterium salinarum]MCF2206715.1 ABC transporter ATP-binding protein [Halobacterium salinarum]
MTSISLSGITKRFPGVVANDDVTLTVEEGTVHALLGENGAGKTTLMNVLYGLYEPDEGTVSVDGTERAFDSPRDAIDAGIGMIHQHFMLVDSMTVAENVVLGNEPRKWRGLRVDREAARAAVDDLCDRYGFDVDPTARVADVSVGVQQRVEILKALYRGADVLILDEPTAVLTPQEVDDLFEVLGELTAEGKTIIFITHKLGEALHAADDVTVLRDGKTVGALPTADTTREELAELMVGREVLLDIDADAGTPGDTVLDVDSLTVTDGDGIDRVADVSMRVRAGEVYGIAGVDGNGQAELVEAITGLRVPDAGAVTFDGEDVTQRSRRHHIEAGMAYVPEDRHERGLVMDSDLVANGILGSQRAPAFTTGSRIDWQSARTHATDVIDTYDVRPRDADATAASLSGGNQQKFIVGREFERDPDLVVVMHPTRGVDIGSTEFIRERLLELRDEGTAVLLVSSKLDEVTSLSDRLAVLYEGRVMDEVDPDTVTEEALGLLMAGQHPEEQ